MNATVKHKPSCADAFESGVLPLPEALDRILDATRPVTSFECLAIRAALGRVLYADIVALTHVPPHTNSAMDGYALNSEQFPEQGTREFCVIGIAYAGRPFTRQPDKGECIRIMTGAAIPPGTDSVVMQEQVEPLGNRIKIGKGHRRGQNVRLAGEDITAGNTLLNQGTRLRAAELGLLASQGIAEVCVYRRPRVAFFSTGNELCSLGETRGDNAIYDSNRYTLFGMLSELGMELIDMGVVKDQRDTITDALQCAASNADLVITTGGVSVGEADYVKDVLQLIGKVVFWKVAMKPGRPLAFGQLADALVFGLPGNPVAVMVTFEQLVKPALRRLTGETDRVPLRLQARCLMTIRKRPGRTEFVRGILERDSLGHWAVCSTGAQGSGILSSMSRANCLIVLPESSGTVGTGEYVEVEPFPP
ncbi:MAG TPA: molybdopterin molybdenumtransferase MoeA [Gammaproteobacteria bacterium]|nr:molybdopterin molybdenumtransferase MoeA [Gammaproteobacteria bacterium]